MPASDARRLLVYFAYTPSTRSHAAPPRRSAAVRACARHARRYDCLAAFSPREGLFAIYDILRRRRRLFIIRCKMPGRLHLR